MMKSLNNVNIEKYLLELVLVRIIVLEGQGSYCLQQIEEGMGSEKVQIIIRYN